MNPIIKPLNQSFLKVTAGSTVAVSYQSDSDPSNDKIGSYVVNGDESKVVAALPLQGTSLPSSAQSLIDAIATAPSVAAFEQAKTAAQAVLRLGFFLKVPAANIDGVNGDETDIWVPLIPTAGGASTEIRFNSITSFQTITDDASVNGLTGSSASDWIRGLDGGDYISINSQGGLDWIDGGADGEWGDTISYRGFNSGGVYVDLTRGFAYGLQGGAEFQFIVDIEHIHDSPAADYLLGNAKRNWFNLTGGDDTADGGSNDPSGADVVMYNNLDDGVNVNLVTGVASGPSAGTDTLIGIEAVHGSQGNDVITLSDGSGYAFGESGDDLMSSGSYGHYLNGGPGNDTLNGAGGFDTAAYDWGSLGDQALNLSLISITPVPSGLTAKWVLRSGVTDWVAFEQPLGSTDLRVSDLRGTSFDVSPFGTDLLTEIENITFSARYGSNPGRSYNVANISINLSASMLSLGLSSFLIVGTDQNDSINGTNSSETIIAKSGADSINAGAGSDSIELFDSGASDTIQGGSGYDRVNLSMDENTLNLASQFYSIESFGIDPGNVSSDRVIIVSPELFNGMSSTVQADGSSLEPMIRIALYSPHNMLYSPVTIDGRALLEGTGRIDASAGFENDVIYGSANDDSLSGNAGADSIFGGEGDDTLEGSYSTQSQRAGAAVIGDLGDWLDGQSGNDRLIGDQGADTLIGGSGSDWLAPGPGSNSVVGGEGFDTLQYWLDAGTDFALTVSSGLQLNPWGGQDTVSGVEEIYVDGSGGHDKVIGDSQLRNRIWGAGGNDTIVGGVNADNLTGWSGADSLVGQGGDDWLQANANGGDSNDTIDGGDGFDVLSYNYWGWNQAVTFVSAFVQGVAPYSQVDPGGGTDTILNMERVVIYGGQLNDSLTGDATANELGGNEGDDTLIGGAGDDTLMGHLGNDYFVPGPGDDSIDGGFQTRYLWPPKLSDAGGENDFDRLDYRASTSGISVDLTSRRVTVEGEAGVDRFTNIEEIFGSTETDVIRGTVSEGSSFSFSGFGGSDLISQIPSINQPWINGLTVSYWWSPTPVSIVWDGDTGRASYGSGTVGGAGITAGVDVLENVTYLDLSPYDDSVDLRSFTVGHEGLITRPVSGNSFNWVSLRAGNDTIEGNGSTWISIPANDSTSLVAGRKQGVSIDLSATPDANGFITLNLSHLQSYAHGASINMGSAVKIKGISRLAGTPFDDTLKGGMAINDDFENFRGGAGNDLIDGGRGWDRADYNTATDGVNINLAGGSVTTFDTSNTSVGVDTLRGIEEIRGSAFADYFNAKGFSAVSVNVGSEGWLGQENSFEGMGGDDSIVGNNYTKIHYSRGMVPIKVDLRSGTTSALNPQDAYTEAFMYSVGNDRFSGVYFVQGTALGDYLIGGGAGAQTGAVSLEGFRGGAGNDTIDGGPGWDFASYYDSPSAIQVDLRKAAGQVQDGFGSTDTLIGIEHIKGSFYADWMLGSDTSFQLSINDASTGQRQESFSGLKGADSIDGGGGYDEVNFPESTAGVVVRLAGWVGASGALPAGVSGSSLDSWGDIDLLTNIEGVEGTPYDDLLVGSSVANRLDGGAGNDTLDGASGNDWVEYNEASAGIALSLLAGSASNDGYGYADVLINIENVQGSIFSDSIVGSASNNTLEGGDGNDTLSGESGADELWGGGNDDYLVGGMGGDRLDGGSGNDTLVGGKGIDRMTGGSGADRFVIGLDDLSGAYGMVGSLGLDAITDFGPGDTIDLSAFGTDLVYRGWDATRDSAKKEIWLETRLGKTVLAVERLATGADTQYLDLGWHLVGLEESSRFVASTGLLSAPSTFVPINPKGSFLLNDGSAPGTAQQPTTLELSTVSASAGEYLVLSLRGAYRTNSDRADSSKWALASFVDAAGNRLDAPVTSRIVTSPNPNTGLATDVQEDFALSTDQSIVVQIPVGATMLALMPNDWFVGDNDDPNSDFGVMVAEALGSDYGVQLSTEGASELKEGARLFALIGSDPDGKNPSGQSLQWQRLSDTGIWQDVGSPFDPTAITPSGSIADSYLLGDLDVGTRIRAKYTYLDKAGRSETVFSKPSALVLTQGNHAPVVVSSERGTVVIDLPDAIGSTYQAALQDPNGGVLVALNLVSSSLLPIESRIVRLKADGSLDTAFGVGGFASVPVAGGDITNLTLAIQSDGKILRGYSAIVDGKPTAVIDRLLTSGQLDQTFAADGSFELALPSGYNGQLFRDIKVLSNGSMLISSSLRNPIDNPTAIDLGIYRITSSGQIDLSFGTNGLALASVDLIDYVRMLDVQPSGRIIVASGGDDGEVNLLAFTSTGQVDNSFGTNGVATQSTEGFPWAMRVLADGRILLGCTNQQTDAAKFPVLVMLKVDGTLDTSFGNAGKLLVEGVEGASIDDSALDVIGDRIFVSLSSTTNNALLTRAYSTVSGSPVETFGVGGIGKVDGFGVPVDLRSSAESSTSIIRTGLISDPANPSQGPNLIVSRLLINGQIDAGFNPRTEVPTGSKFVPLDPLIRIIDQDMLARGHYAGATILIQRQGGPNASDLFDFPKNTSNPTELLIDGVVIGTASSAAGSLSITFSSSATQQRLDKALQSILYASNGGVSGQSFNMDWTFSDAGGAWQYAGSAVNDSPAKSVIATTPVMLSTQIVGSNSDENLTGTTGADLIRGLGGVDWIYGGDGDDQIFGGDGNDFLYGEAGNDTIDGGPGFDRAFYDNALGPVFVDLRTGIVSQDGYGGSDLLLNIERVRGGAFNDSLVGSAAHESFSGLGGDDTIDGGAGFDEVFYGYPQTTAVTVDLTAGTAAGGEGNDVLIGIEAVTGSSGADSMRGSAAADRLRGSAGSDTILGAGGNDALYGGDTTLDNVTVAGALHNDLLIGGAGRDTIYVDAGVDTVIGGDSNTDGSPRLPFIKAGLLDRDVLSLTQANTSVINLSTRTYTLDTSYGTGSGSYAGIAEIWGSAGKDIVSGRTSASAADLAGGTEIWLSLNGGSDEVNGETYGVQQRWATGPMVSYSWSLTPVQVVYTANQATVAYSASGVQLAGQDRLTNVGYINGSKFADSFDLTQATTNHLGFATSPLFGRSWITLNLSRGGGDTVIGNGWTMLSFADVDASTNDQGLTVDLRNSSANLSNLSFQGTSLSTLSYSGVFALIGTKYNDRLTGGVSINATEYFEGLGGNDTIDGGSGWDVASYSHSAARITVNLAQGSVVADAGGAGQDQLRSVEAIRGSNFNDILDARGFSGDAATSGPNRSSFLSGSNEISPEGGNDTIHGNGATELSFYRSMVGVTVDLGTGVADARLEADKATEAYKTQGRDAFSGVYRITGSSLDDQLLGGGPGLSIAGQFAGLEVFTPGPGNDTVDGRGGADLVTYEDAPAGIVVDLRKSGSQVTNDGWGFTDHLIGVRLLMGSHLGDSIRGADSAGYESFWGMKGSDSIDGGGGVDDEISYSDDPSGVIVKLGAWVGATGGPSAGFSGSALDGWGTIDLLQGIEGVEGSAFEDEITGNAADNRLDGGTGNDTLDGGTGNDWAEYNGADESVVVNLETGFASSDGQRLIFSMANLGESMRTTTGQDKLISIENIQGGAAGDQITGSSLANILQGESGDDTLRGGKGNDTLDGGSGSDWALYSGPYANYTVSVNADGSLTVTDNRSSSDNEGVDRLTGIESLKFSDQTVIPTSSQRLVSVNPKGTYLADANDPVDPPTSFSLSLIGASAGSTITLSQRGDFQYGLGEHNGIPFIDNGKGLLARFVNSAGVAVSPPAWLGSTTPIQSSGKSTDISEDFSISNFGITQIVVPTNAVSLQFTVSDVWYSDNNDPDGDFSVLIGLANTSTSYLGSDLIFGGGSNDSLMGSEGHDSLRGGAGDDTLRGGLGDDRLYGDAGSDVLDGGEQRRKPWGSTSGDYDIAVYESNSIRLDLAAGAVTVTGESGVDTLIGIEEVRGSIGKPDLVFGALAASSGGASSIWLSLNGGNDTVESAAYGYQQPWVDGAMVGYAWSKTGIELSYVGNTATVSYGAADGQTEGEDKLVHVGIIGDSPWNDRFDLSEATQNQFGYVLDTERGTSWHALLLGRGGSDIVLGNGQTNINFAAVTSTDNGLGLYIDLKQGSANLSNLLNGGVRNGLLSFQGVRSVTGTRFDDVLVGGLVANDNFESFRGDAGDDFIDGGSGYDRADYRSSRSPITVNLAAGTVTSTDAGSDTLRSVEEIRGSMYNDYIDARGFKGGSTSASSNIGSYAWGLNQVIPEGGDDIILGNGVTRISFANSMLPVIADMRQGYADARMEADKTTEAYKTLGRDSFSGVYHLTGTAFDDVLLGGGVGRTSTGILPVEGFRGGAGNDTIDGRDGWDTASYEDSPQGIVVDLRLVTSQVQDGWGFFDTLIGIEEILGSDSNDVLIGSNGSTQESFAGNKGADSVDGGAGYDEVGFYQDPSGVEVRLGGWSGTSGVLPNGWTGSARDGWGDIDLLRNVEGVEGSNYNDRLIGDAGENRLDGRSGNDTLDGGAGNDWAEYNQALEAVTVDLELGTAANDGYRLYTGAIGIDTLISIENVQGGQGNDSITGSSLANVLHGESGDDTLTGAAGNDTLKGGDGVDVLVYRGAMDEYTITADLAAASFSVEDHVDGRDGTDTVLSQGEVLRFTESAEYEIAPSGYWLSRLSTGDDTFDFRLVTGWSQAQMTWQDAIAGQHLGFIGNFTNQAMTRDGESLAPYSLRDPYGGVDTVKVAGVGGPPDLTFWSGPTNDFVSFEGNSQTSFIWNTSPNSGHDTVIGGGALSTIDFFFDGALDVDLTGHSGSLVLSSTAKVDYTNVNRWRFWNGDYTVNGSSNNEQFEVWARSVSFELNGASGGSDQINFTGWKSTSVTVSGLGSDDDLVFNANEFGPIISSAQLGISYNATTNSTRLVVNASAGKTATIDLLGGNFVVDQFKYNPSNPWLNAVSFRLNTQPVTFTGTSGNDSLTGTSGSDTIDGLGGEDQINGLAGDDWLYGSDGDDSLQGGEGRDRIRGGRGNDTIDGGVEPGGVFTWNEASYADAPAGIVADLQSGIVSNDGYGNQDKLIRINEIRLSNFNDSVIGSENSDVFYDLAGNDTVDGAAGTDYVWYGNASSAVYVDLTSGTASSAQGQAALTSIEGVATGAWNDRIIGNALPNLLRGAGGADTILAGDGDDAVYGSDIWDQPGVRDDGADYLDGEEGNDRILGDRGADTMLGGSGEDTLAGHSGNDVIDGGDGWDTLWLDLRSSALFPNQTPVAASLDLSRAASAQWQSIADGFGGLDQVRNMERVWVSGTALDDQIIGSSGNDRLDGNDGSDRIDGGVGNDSIRGGLFSRESSASNWSDSLMGGAGNDDVYGGGGNDSLVGGDGDDRLMGNRGSDSLWGGAGLDRVMLDFSTKDRSIDNTARSVTLDLSGLNLGSSFSLRDEFGDFDLIAEVEGFAITGSTLADTFKGSSGSDELWGREGADSILGGMGNDFLDGGDGFNWLSEGVEIVANADTLRGGQGADTLYGFAGGDALYGDEDDDWLMPGIDTAYESFAFDTAFFTRNLTTSFNTTLDGGPGNDTVVYAHVTDAMRIDIGSGLPDQNQATHRLEVSATTSNKTWTDSLIDIEHVIAGGGDDLIRGNGLANRLEGASGNDTLYGGAGNDTLIGGEGNDLASFPLSLTNGSLANYVATSYNDGAWGSVRKLSWVSNSTTNSEGNLVVSTVSSTVEEDRIEGIERLEFSGSSIDLSADSPLRLAVAQSGTQLLLKVYLKAGQAGIESINSKVRFDAAALSFVTVRDFPTGWTVLSAGGGVGSGTLKFGGFRLGEVLESPTEDVLVGSVVFNRTNAEASSLSFSLEEATITQNSATRDLKVHPGLEIAASSALSITSASSSVLEGSNPTGAGLFNVTVSLDRPLLTEQSISWTLAGTGAHPASAGDFVGSSTVMPSGTLSFEAGETSKTFSVALSADSQLEHDEQFQVILTPASGSSLITAGLNSPVFTILNDDKATLTLTPVTLSKAEGQSGATAFNYSANLDQPLLSEHTINWQIKSGSTPSASADDFVGGLWPTGSINFAPGELQKNIEVLVAGDTQKEATESFTLSLTAPVGSSELNLGAAVVEASGQIRNDEGAKLTLPVVWWRSGAKLKDVAITAVGGANSSTDPNALIHFKAPKASLDANGRPLVTIEVWAQSPNSFSNFDFALSTATNWSPSFAMDSAFSTWLASSNLDSQGVLRVAAISYASSANAGGLRLGTISLTVPGTGSGKVDLSLVGGHVGNGEVQSIQTSIARSVSSSNADWNVEDLNFDRYSILPSRTTADRGNSISSADALATLKIAVGLSPNAGSSPVSLAQFAAADVDRSGSVNSADALNVLKMAVGLSTAPQAEWIWMLQSQASAIVAGTVSNWKSLETLDLSQDLSASIVGVLRGDVDGSWTPPMGP